MMEWTHEDDQRAKEEGWRRYGDFVMVQYTPEGGLRFSGAYEIISHLRHRGIQSEWHKNVYLSLPWVVADDMMALSEGWRLKTLQSESDDAACQYVLERAKSGDPLHIKALAVLAKRRLTQGS